MKSTILAITALASLALAMDATPRFIAVGPGLVVKRENAPYEVRGNGKLFRRSCDQNKGEVTLTCPAGQQVICNHKNGQYECYIKNGAAYCKSLGFQGELYYEDKNHNICCSHACKQNDVQCKNKLNKLQNAKAPCGP
ncbi:hypothetical protein AC578_4390 [Pseudocercospora eumusae]|uniref:Uncharacterized protein n=1 Tax=Pseudocercospora eumusae TaxID=321146 RepID=A0A139H6C3_9PEZI|nr:hypothetical protein AC578_4390 [Pseudocercospora eumusae]